MQVGLDEDFALGFENLK